jgi:hypothetical protein
VSDDGATVASVASVGDAKLPAWPASGSVLSVDRATDAIVLDGNGTGGAASALVAERLHENESQTAASPSQGIPPNTIARFDIALFSSSRMRGQ